MRFRLVMTAHSISLYPGGVVPVDLTIVRNGREVRVSIGSEDAEQGAHLVCMAETEFDPPRRIVEDFKHLAANRLPAGHPPRAEWGKDHDYIDEDGNILGRYVVPLALTPLHFQQFGRELDRDLSTAIFDAVNLLRWRTRTLGPRRPFATRGVEWTLDGEEWVPLPTETRVELLDQSRLEVSPDAAAGIQALLDRGELEPLAHQLLREAWDQRTSHPRSALLIGMAALEVGLKQYISACLPPAAWLVDNVPSPPVVTMIVDYLPTLEPPEGGVPFVPPDEDTVKVLKVAVTLRNELAHTGADIGWERLHRTLRAVRNVLWALDVARGHEWAAEYVTSLDSDPSIGYRAV